MRTFPYLNRKARVINPTQLTMGGLDPPIQG
jgi:hypothetical protein